MERDPVKDDGTMTVKKLRLSWMLSHLCDGEVTGSLRSTGRSGLNFR